MNGTGTTTVSGGAGTSNTFNIDSSVTFYDDSAGVITFGSNVTVNSSVTVWNGKNSSVWTDNANWAFGVPAAGSKVIIAKTTTAPVLSSVTAELSEVTIVKDAKFTLDSGANLQAATITNNGELTIKAGTITGTTSTPNPTLANGTDSTIIYDGVTSPVWGTSYNNLKIESGSITFSEDITVTKTFTINSDFTNNAVITAKENVTSTANMTGSGKITFAGDAEQIFTTGGKSYSKIDKSGNNALTIIGGATFTEDVELNTKGTVTLGGTYSTASLTFGGPVVLNTDTSITTSAETKLVWFKNTVTGNPASSLTINTGKTQFDGAVSNLSTLTTADVEIKGSSITTSGTQTYNGIITLSADSVTLNATEIDFDDDIAGGSNTLKINTPIFKSTNGSAATVTAGEVELVQSSNFQSTTGITFNASKTSGSTTTLTNSGTLTLVNNIEVESALVNSGSLTCSGNAIFDNDVDLSSGTFSHSTGTVTLTASKKTSGTPATLSGSSTFANLTISGNANITDDNTITGLLSATGLTATITFSNNTRQTAGSLALSGNSGDGNKLNLTSTSGTWIIESGSAPSTLENLSVTNSNNDSGFFFTATDSIDNGGNTSWNFPGNTYTWEGDAAGDTNNWKNAANWNLGSIPGNGAIVVIPAGLSSTNYPILNDNVDIDNGDATNDNGTITINGQLDLAGFNIKSKKITNNGTVRLTGSETFTRTDGTTLTDLVNGENSIVEYYGTGATLSHFAWGQNYEKLVINESAVIHTQLTVNKTTTITAASTKTVTLDSTANVFTGNVILGATGTPTGNVELVANGTITLTNNAEATGLTIQTAAKIQNVKTSGAQNYNGDTTISSEAEIKSTGDNITFAADKTLSVNAATKITVPDTKYINFNGTVTGTAKLTTAGAGLAKFNTSITSLGELETQAAQINCASITTTSGSQIYNGATELTVNTELSAPTGHLIQFNGAVSGTVNLKTSGAAVAEFKNSVNVTKLETQAVKINTTSAITATDTQTYNGAVELAENTTLSAGTSVTFNENVSGSKSLEITGPLYVNCEEITTSGNSQTYNGNVNLGVNSKFTASRINFKSDITDGAVDGSRKSLTVDSAVLESAIDSGSASIILGELIFAGNTSIQTTSGTTIAFKVPLFSGEDKTITLASNGSTFTFDGNVEINPNFATSDGTSLTASTGTMTFKADLDLANNTLTANGGSIVLSAENKTGAAILKGNNTYNTLEFTGPINVQGSNTITTLTANAATLAGKTITFDAGTSQIVTNMSLKGTGTSAAQILTLKSNGSGNWNISCTNEPVLDYLVVEHSTNNSPGTPIPNTNFIAFHSTDGGSNNYWNFPDMEYKWLGTTSTNWNITTNWEHGVIPTKGAKKIEIAVSAKNNYPSLIAELDLNTTYNGSAKKANIIVDAGATLDLADQPIKVGEIKNQGLVKLNGIDSQIDGTTTNDTTDGASPTVEYTGSGATTYFVWDGDADTDGKQYVNLVLNRTNAVVSEKLFTTGNLTIKATASVSEDIEVSNVLTINAATTIAADKSISVKGDVSSTANVSGDGKLIFTGSANQVFAAGGKTYSNIEEAKDGNGKLTVNTNLTVTNFTITTGAQTVFAGAPTITTLAAENTTGTIAFNGGGTITNDVEFKTAGQVTFGDANTDSITFSNNVTHTAGPTQITGTLNAVNLYLGVLTIPVGAVTKLNTSGNQTYNGAISGGGTLTIYSGTTGTINFNAAVNGTTPLSSLTTTGAVVINSSLIKTSGAQTYNSTIDLGSPTSLLLEGSAITFNDDISDTTTATSLEVNTPVTINCSNITTAGNQIYYNTITLKKSPTLSAGTSVTFKNNIANSASAPAATNLTVKANTVIDAANISITTSEFDFSGNISGSGTNNILTLSTPVLKSIAATATSSNITLAKLIINQNTTIETENSTQINAYISEINNSGKTLIIESSVANFAFQKETTVNSHIQTKDGSKLTAWSGTTTFNGDIEIAGDFEHSNGTVKFAGATQTLKTRTDGSTNFYNILISSSDKVTTDSSFIVSGTSWTSSTSTQNFTATACTITFDNATASAASPTTVSGKNNFYDVVCKTAGQNITFEADNIFSNTVTIGDSTATPSAIMTGTVNISSSEAITFNPNLYCNKLTINAGTKNVSFNGNATYGEAFTNNGTGSSVFKASFTGTGDAIFNGDIYITDTATPRSFSAGSGKKIETNKNIIVDTTDTNIININTHTDSLVKAYNFVLYSGKVSLDGTLDTKGSTAETTGDIILLGPDYTTMDPQTGIDGIYLYNQTRPSSANFTTDFRASYNGEVTISSGATMQAGKNFYANGLSLNGTGEWNLKLTKTSDSEKGFAEAIKTEVSNCKVSCHQDTSTATDDNAPAKVVAYECTDNSGNTNWNFDDFEILNAWTVRDNAIYVEFNAPVRNLYNEIINSLSFLTDKGTASASTAFTGIYSTPDCQEANLIKNKNKDIELTNGRYSLYLKAPDSWNTDATGNSTGRSSLSSDRNGNHKSSIPYIDIPRSLSGTNYIITNRWGKRLNNYSTRTTTPGYSYGTNENTGNETYVLDKTGPVLWTVRTGQEMHDSYKTSDGENSQYDFDAHNFIEFRYSEPVTFNSDTIPDNAVNIPVTSSFGAVNTSSESDTLTFAGLANLEAPAGNTLQLYTGSNGSDDKLVNALYRLDEYSIRISIAGWTDGTITDYIGNAFKKWPGYIEKASQFTGAKAKAVTTPLVQDKATTPNTQEEYDDGYKVEPLVYSDSSSANPSALLPLTRTKPDGTVSNADVYSPWDLSEPVFTPLRFSSGTAWGSDTMSEAIGNTNGTGSTLDRIDFHFFDNTPAYDSSDPAEWFTEIGWCNPNSEASKSNLLNASYTFCADIIGGARQFDTDENRRTTGGIRFSTKAGISPAFRYSTSMNDTNPSTSFLTGIANIHTTIVSQLFTGSSSPMRPANDPDGLYLGLGLTDTDLSVETTFAFTYNENLGYLTDLAGNRLRSKLSKTIDRTPPSFDAIISPVDTKSVYIIFVKELVTDSSKIKFSDNSGVKIDISETYTMLMPKCFRIISIDAGGNAIEDSEIQIDTSVPAQIIAANSNESFTCLKLTTTKDIDIEHLKNLYVQLVMPAGYPTQTCDPLTSNINSRVTFIQDQLGNYMSMYSAHSLSDFAVNYVKPLYAYTTDMTENDASLMEGLYEEGSWAVHDFEADQQNYGTLPANHPLAIVADTKGDEKIRSYLSPSPDAASVSKQFNADFGTKLRVWLPALQDSVFRALSAANNTNFVWKDGSLMDDNPDNSIFELSTETVSAWNSGSQISFMFSLMKDASSPVRIYNNPFYDVQTDKFDLSQTLPVPLFCLRMPDVTDINSLDLWSFKVRSVTEQRGGVSIFNNVIDAGKNEKTVIKVNLASEGKLNVMVMTLDGNIITYLNRGKANAGEHYFTWNGRNRNGNIVARGMYFIRVIGSGIDETRKVMVVK